MSNGHAAAFPASGDAVVACCAIIVEACEPFAKTDDVDVKIRIDLSN
jgi:hypothetical protein